MIKLTGSLNRKTVGGRGNFHIGKRGIKIGEMNEKRKCRRNY